MLQFWFMGLGPVYPQKTQNILIKNQNNLFEWFQPATQVVTGLINLGKTCSSNLNKLVQLHKKVIFLFQHNLQCRPLARRRSKRTKTLLLFCFKMPIALIPKSGKWIPLPPGAYFQRCKQRPLDGGIIFKWAMPGLFFVYFRSFQTNNTIFTTN